MLGAIINSRTEHLEELFGKLPKGTGQLPVLPRIAAVPFATEVRFLAVRCDGGCCEKGPSHYSQAVATSKATRGLDPM